MIVTGELVSAPVAWPVTQPLVDGFGRVHRDLRISVTDRCNLRCTYCMPAEGMNWLPRAEVLTFEEIERIARLLVERFGFTSIRLTGGEPTVRAQLPVLVERLAALGVDLVADDQRHQPRAASPTTWPRPGCAASTSRSTRSAATASSSSPAATASTRCSTASMPRSTPGSRP